VEKENEKASKVSIVTVFIVTGIFALVIITAASFDHYGIHLRKVASDLYILTDRFDSLVNENKKQNTHPKK
jgi:hypothetical protein